MPIYSRKGCLYKHYPRQDCPVENTETILQYYTLLLEDIICIVLLRMYIRILRVIDWLRGLGVDCNCSNVTTQCYNEDLNTHFGLKYLFACLIYIAEKRSLFGENVLLFCIISFLVAHVYVASGIISALDTRKLNV